MMTDLSAPLAKLKAKWDNFGTFRTWSDVRPAPKLVEAMWKDIAAAWEKERMEQVRPVLKDKIYAWAEKEAGLAQLRKEHQDELKEIEKINHELAISCAGLRKENETLQLKIDEGDPEWEECLIEQGRREAIVEIDNYANMIADDKVNIRLKLAAMKGAKS